MKPERYKMFVSRVSACRDAAQCATLLEELEQALSEEDELFGKKEVLSLMQSVVRLQDSWSHREITDQAETIINRLITLDPEDAHPYVVLSEFYFFDRADFERALKIAEDAVSIAKERGEYFNLATGHLARVATKLKRYDLVAFAMEQVLERPRMTDVVDTKIETDFVFKLPNGAVSDKLIKDYLGKAGKV